MATTDKNFKVKNGIDIGGTATATLFSGSGASLTSIPNSALTNSSITINGSAVSLGGSVTIDALPSQTGQSGKYLTTNGTVASWGTVSSYSAPTIGSTSIGSGATVTTIAGLTLTSPTISTIINTGTLTLPTSTDTLVGRATTDTLTNKTLSTTSTSTVNTNSATTVDTTALSGFTTMKFVVSIKQGSKIRSSELLVQTDGTSVDYTEYGVVETGGTMNAVSVASSVSSTNCITTVYIANAATTNATVKLFKVLM